MGFRSSNLGSASHAGILAATSSVPRGLCHCPCWPFLVPSTLYFKWRTCIPVLYCCFSAQTLCCMLRSNSRMLVHSSMARIASLWGLAVMDCMIMGTWFPGAVHPGISVAPVLACSKLQVKCSCSTCDMPGGTDPRWQHACRLCNRVFSIVLFDALSMPSRSCGRRASPETRWRVCSEY